MGEIKRLCCKPFQTEQNYVNTVLHPVCLQPSCVLMVKPQSNLDLWRKQNFSPLGSTGLFLISPGTYCNQAKVQREIAAD